uniref:Apple domain-containing protein n=1 Tax=Haemonchus contortus TaxID=6289 RepID=A0A7I4XV87_HAECO
EATHLIMMWPSATLAVVVFFLQVAQSPSCTFNSICQRPASLGNVLYWTSSNSLHDCLKKCYLIKNCTYAVFDSGSCWGGVNISLEDGVDRDFCGIYTLERDSIADPEQCKSVSDLL